MRCKPCIIICTEARLKEENIFININGYVSYFNTSKLSKADGIVVHILEKLKHEFKLIEIGKTNSPIVTLTLRNKKSITISPIYRSHKYKLDKFTEKLQSWVILMLTFRTIV